MKPLSPTFYGYADPYQPETTAELYARIDREAHMLRRAALAADLVTLLKTDVEMGNPCPGWDWEDIISAVEDASKMFSTDACAAMAREQEAHRKARLIAAGARASALEKAMQS